MASTVNYNSAGSLAAIAPSPVVKPPAATLRAVAICALMLVAFWPILTSMYGSWMDDRAYMEHGILVIPAAVYMAWTKRQKLAQIPLQPSAWGLVLLAWGAAQATLSVVAFWPWVGRTAFLISLLGAILALYGTRMAYALIYPLCTLLLMIAPPGFIYDRLTLSLQLLASRLGETFLEALGYSVMREGNILELVGTKLSVEEACSGIRSLFSILFMCTLYNFFFVRGNLTKALILVMAIPIAILGNAGRILATGIASQYNRDLIQGVSHEAFGYISVVVAALGCVALHLIILLVQRSWRSRHA
jgi:exosortase